MAEEVRLGSARGAFRLLFDDISGGNEPTDEIAMTAPVEMGHSDEAFVMRFFLPAGFTVDTAPRPTDPRVTVVSLAGAHVAVAGFTGWWTEAGAARRQAALVQRLDETAWQPAGPAAAWFYDPPWTLPFLRRNESPVPVVARDAAVQPSSTATRPEASDS